MSLLDRIKGRIGRAADERRISASARAVRREKLTYLTPAKFRRLEAAVARAIAGSEGDVLEFGVAMGGSAIVLARHAHAGRRQFHGFDVFSMIPPPTSEKDDEKSKARYETIASGASEGLGGEIYYGYRDNLLTEVCESFKRHGLEVDGGVVHLHQGLFEETWGGYRGTSIAFAHIDCDWYDPVKFCLEKVTERMGAGGLIVLDDYHDYGGCKVAVDEFLKARSDFRLEDGENVVLVRQARG